MLIKTLLENTSASKDLACEHGLSLYIETKQHKILFDTGASEKFAENAEKMQVDLSQVDLVIISHGHVDHGGGIRAFLNVNHQAKILIHKLGFGDYYSNRPSGEKKYIGLDKTLLLYDRFVFVDGNLLIDDELELFSGVHGTKLNPTGNRNLFMQVDDSFVEDEFLHEQNLIIRENDHEVLVAGCAHRGIVNIVEHFRVKYGKAPSHVIGGFHLYNRSTDQTEEPSRIAEIGSCLLSTGAEFYTGHCTGVKAYEMLKSSMGDRVHNLATGDQLII